MTVLRREANKFELRFVKLIEKITFVSNSSQNNKLWVN